MRRRFLVALSVILVASVALAQARLPERPMRIEFAGGAMNASFSARSLADDGVRRALGSGLSKQFVMTVQAYVRGSSTPIASRQLICRVVYDLWEESYVVRRGRRTEVVRTVDEAITRCLDASRVAIANDATLATRRGREVFVAVRAEFNPISASACARSLGRPGGDDPLGPVVVNIVRREICQAERALEFRSAYVRVP